MPFGLLIKDHRPAGHIQQRIRHEAAVPARSFNLHFHSVPSFGDNPSVENHYDSMRSRFQKSILASPAQDAEAG